MDMMIPFLGKISRLDVEHKGAFYIAGLKDSKISQIELEKRKKAAYERKKMLEKNQPKEQETAVTTDEDSQKHLDTWA